MKSELTFWDKVKQRLYWLKYWIARHVLLSYVPRSQGWYVDSEEVTGLWRQWTGTELIIWTVGEGVFSGWTAGYEFIPTRESEAEVSDGL